MGGHGGTMEEVGVKEGDGGDLGVRDVRCGLIDGVTATAEEVNWATPHTAHGEVDVIVKVKGSRQRQGEKAEWWR